jgi:hypothetical protein
VFIAPARLLAAVALLLLVPVAAAQNKCTAKGVMAGQAYSLANCEVAYYPGGDNSVTIWFSDTPIGAEEREFFQRSSSADRFKKGRTMVSVGFCPGGGSATPSPSTAKSVEIAFNHATVVDLGPQNQWVLNPRKDKSIAVERLSGDLRKGGKLAGRITGATSTRAGAFRWDLEFDLALPQNVAGGGPGC